MLSQKLILICAKLFSEIVLSGGSTFLRGFGDRLLTELKHLAPRDTKIRIFAPPERKTATWLGGSILSSLSTFKKVIFLFVFLYGTWKLEISEISL